MFENLLSKDNKKFLRRKYLGFRSRARKISRNFFGAGVHKPERRKVLIGSAATIATGGIPGDLTKSAVSDSTLILPADELLKIVAKNYSLVTKAFHSLTQKTEVDFAGAKFSIQSILSKDPRSLYGYLDVPTQLLFKYFQELYFFKKLGGIKLEDILNQNLLSEASKYTRDVDNDKRLLELIGQKIDLSLPRLEQIKKILNLKNSDDLSKIYEALKSSLVFYSNLLIDYTFNLPEDEQKLTNINDAASLAENVLEAYEFQPEDQIFQNLSIARERIKQKSKELEDKRREEYRKKHIYPFPFLYNKRKEC